MAEKVELTKELKETMTKNQLARLFTIRVCKHFSSAVEMDKEQFFKYLREANDELKEYIKTELEKEKRKIKKGKGKEK
jgi:hypothetical protein